MNGFDIQNKKGQCVQEIVKRHLQSRGNTIIDVSLDRAYQKKDIDFLVRKDGKETTLEIKNDNSLFRTYNILFEAGKQKGNYYSSGWLLNCEAQYGNPKDTELTTP